MSPLDMGTALLRQMDAERAHEMAIAGLRYLPLGVPKDDPILPTRVAGLDLPNPVGLAAGLDKNAVAIRGLAGLGFGFVECGSVTPRPQTGNPRPRLFRLEEDRAVINRMGFNNDGLEAFADRLAHRPPGVVVGANLGANKDADDRIADYETGLRRLGGLADYLTVNVSSPNTPGLRGLQTVEALEPLLARIQAARPKDRPVFLKIAPDLSDADIGRIVEASLQYGLDGLIVSNTTLDRPETLRSAHAAEAGGLSGAPLKDRARRALTAAVEAADGRLPLIAVGGIADGAEAYARIRAGASAVQLYSALVFEGPGLVRRIKADLVARLKADGFSTVAEAVGTAR
ncbi:quinone-dependent dihydroorotate dehydrogenase [Brevundimonas poindexterae]|uniref:quinone-dependent dihydroorotate dehydrogenase n=1 Tax=Brevundimonas poindexterae TaxID=74325 RepID=UPI001CFC490E|nr:quinone-dependent dihydroorotate dehydrogenase [Brevundimonas poindexterae]